jgi:endonuclease/exonuclease/phosphatase family metal-dependent hydrolase
MRVSGLAPPYPLFPLLAFTPLAAGAALLAALWALLLRRRAAAATALLVAAVLAVAVAPRILGHAQPDIEGPTIRVMSANLHYGGADLDQLSQVALDEGADVISLEELTPDAATALLSTPLAAAMPFRIFDPVAGGVGTGLMSAYPLRRLPVPDVPAERPVIVAALEREGAEAELWSIHLPPPIDDASTKSLVGDLEGIPPPDPLGAPRILAGDFNSTLDHPPFHDLLLRGYADAAESLGEGLSGTWPSGRSFPPLVTIDHLLGDGRVAFSDYSRHEIAGTDHRAVVASVTFAGS